jgi:hypothetical protein
MLVNNLLDESLSPRQVINTWPAPYPSGDRSLDAIYQMVWHVEADENQQAQEPLYLDTQLASLELAYWALRQNRDLPETILLAYPAKPLGRFYTEKAMIDPVAMTQASSQNVGLITHALHEVSQLLVKVGQRLLARRAP